MDEKLAALAADIERQNAAFDDARNALEDAGDVELRVPNAALEELDALTEPPARLAAFAPCGIRA
jgi:hypothetical protein